jgi:CheY-like chemotaxis protein
VPIIAVTANANQDRVAEFLASGMTEITTKPVDISLLETTMRRVLASSGAAVASSEPDRIALPASRETRPAPEPVGADDGATGRSATTDAGGEARAAEVKPQGAKILPGPKPKRRASAPAGKQPARPTASIVSMVQPQMADSPAPSADAVALLDEETMADLEEQLGREYMCKMTLRFADEADRALAELSDTEAEGDLPRAAQVAHKAAGAAAALGLKGLHRVLVTFENEAKAGQREAARERIARIEAIKADTFALLRDRGLIA